LGQYSGGKGGNLNLVAQNCGVKKKREDWSGRSPCAEAGFYFDVFGFFADAVRKVSNCVPNGGGRELTA